GNVALAAEEVAARRGEGEDGADRDQGAEAGDAEEGRPPAEMAGGFQAGRHAEDRGDREGAHHDAHRGAAPLRRDDVGDDRERQRGGGAAEEAGDDPRRHQRGEAGGETAARGSGGGGGDPHLGRPGGRRTGEGERGGPS